MKRVYWNVALVLATATATATATSCQRNDPEERGSTKSPNGRVNELVYPGPLANEDRDFINEAAQGGLLEVQLGQIATRQGSSETVKAFGQHMTTDHSAAYVELKELAARKGYTLATKLDGEHQQHVDDLSKLTGAPFDKEYAQDMVEDHEKDIRLFENAAAASKDADLRAWANKTLPTLRRHLAMALDAKSKTQGTVTGSR